MIKSRLYDVSTFQGTIDWDIMSQSIDGAYIKVSQPSLSTGGLFTDNQFLVNWAETARLSVPRGGYHLYVEKASPVLQAEYFCEQLMNTGSIGELLPVLDVEIRPLTMSKIKSCLDTIEQILGVRPMIYTGVAVWNELGGAPWANDYPLWIANYPLDANGDQYTAFDQAEDEVPHLPADFSDWDLWQFSTKGDGKSNGAESFGLDMNLVNGELSRIQKPENPLPPPEPPGGPPVDVYESLVSGLRVRSEPSLNAPVIGFLNAAELRYVVETLQDGGFVWGNHTAPDMWSAIQQIGGSVFMRKVAQGQNGKAAMPEEQPMPLGQAAGRTT